MKWRCVPSPTKQSNSEWGKLYSTQDGSLWLPIFLQPFIVIWDELMEL